MKLLFIIPLVTMIILGFIQFIFTDNLFGKYSWYKKVKKYIFWIDIVLVFLLLVGFSLSIILNK